MGYWTQTPWDPWRGCSVVENSNDPAVRVLVNPGTDPAKAWTEETFTEHSWFFDAYEVSDADDEDEEAYEDATVVAISFAGVPTVSHENIFFFTEFFRHERLEEFETNLSWAGVDKLIDGWESRRLAFNEAVDEETRKELVLTTSTWIPPHWR